MRTARDVHLTRIGSGAVESGHNESAGSARQAMKAAPHQNEVTMKIFALTVFGRNILSIGYYPLRDRAVMLVAPWGWELVFPLPIRRGW